MENRHPIRDCSAIPLWVLLNVLTIGQLSKIYESQKGRVQIKVCRDFGPLKVNEMGKLLAVMTKFRNVCAHNDRLFDFRTKDAVCDMNIHERLQIAQKSGRYQYGKNDLYAQTIILKLLLPEDELVHQAVLERMGFPEKWDRIGKNVSCYFFV